MRKIYFLLLFFIIYTYGKAQISANGNVGVTSTQYTNGTANDSIFIWIDDDFNANNGSLTANPNGQVGNFTFNWFKHDNTTFSWNFLSSSIGQNSTINQLQSGGYRVEIQDSNSNIVACYVAWVWNMNLEVDADLIRNGCDLVNLIGSIQDKNTFIYYNPPPPISLISPNTIITVCFEAEHTYVSDLSFYLVGPADAGSPRILLNPFNAMACNSGQDVDNLCFTSNSSAGNFNMCTSPTPLTGTYKSFNNQLINWSPLYGVNAASSGWKLQIFDCVLFDVGFLKRAVLTFSNLTSVCGSPTTITYDSGNVNLPINDMSCNPQSASSFNIPSLDFSTPITIQANKTINWISDKGDILNPIQLITSANNLSFGNLDFTLQVELNYGSISNIVSVTKFITNEEIKVNFQVSDVSCFGEATGEAEIIVTGGTAPYTYLWNDVNNQTTAKATGLVSGDYTVVVTDANGCSVSEAVKITQPNAPLQATISSVDILCNGAATGEAEVTVTGGTAPYIYSWNDTNNQTTAKANNLVAGSYTVVITDANGCMLTENVTINQPNSTLSISVTTIDVLCHGAPTGEAEILVSGGTAPYIYLWNDANNQTTAKASGLVAGTYLVTVTDANGCVMTETVVVNQPSASLDSTFSLIDVSCFGEATGEAEIIVTGGTAPYSYSWNDVNNQTTAKVTGLDSGDYTVVVTDANGCSVSETVTITQPNAPLQATISSVDILCNGAATGEAEVMVTGGTAPYSYSWNDANNQTTVKADNLLAGSYTVVITDANGCVLTEHITINQPSVPFNATVTSKDALCYGSATGESEVIVTGGTAPFTYLWNDTNNQTTAKATGLAAGTYLVTVTDVNGCVIQQSVTISQPSANLQISLTSKNVLCYNGSSGEAEVIVTGGTTPYTYLWNDVNNQTTAKATGLISGDYTVVVTDANGCSVSETVTITQPNAPLQATISSVDILCNGATTGEAEVLASGGTAPYSYFWNDATNQTAAKADRLVAGTYTVVITDANGCVLTEDVTINQPDSPLSISVTTIDVSCNGDSSGEAEVTVVGGTTPYTYLWNDVNNQKTAKASGLVAGTYLITITDANGCVATQSVEINEPSSILDASITSVDVMCFGASTGEAEVHVTGGTAPYTYLWNDANSQNTSIATGLTEGTYDVMITDANGCTISKTVVINQPSIPLVATTIVTDILCYGESTGEAEVTVTGGTAPYSYSWNDSKNQSSQKAVGLNAGTYTVTVTDVNGCITTQNVIVNQPTALLDAVINTSDIVCYNASTGEAEVLVSGGTAPYTYLWNDANNQTTAKAIGLSKGTYSVIVTDTNGCSITKTTTVVESTLMSPPLSQDQSYCIAEGKTVADLLVTGSDIKWYTDNSGSIVISPTTVLTTGTYYASQTINGCESVRRTAVNVIIHDTPAPVAYNQGFCLPDNNTVGDIFAIGTNIKWYKSALSTTPIPNNQVLTTGVYYATQTLNGCESVQRTPVSIVIHDVAAPIVQSPQSFCSINNSTVSNLVASGSMIQWYDSPTGGSPLAITDMLVNNKTYYATQTMNGCESVQRTAVQVIINDQPPISTNAITVCANTVLRDVVIDSFTYQDLKWYDTPTSTYPLPYWTALTNNAIYYISIVGANGCESVRTGVHVTVLNPIATVIASQQVFCSAAQVKDLVVQSIPGATVRWYDSSNSTTPLTSTTNLGNGTYFVEQQVGNCTSARIAVAVRVVLLPAPSQNTMYVCENETFENISKDKRSLIDYLFYDSATSTTPISTSQIVTTGYYYVSHTQLGCESQRSRVYIDVTPKPAPPTGSLNQLFVDRGTVVDLKMNEPVIAWYPTYTDAVNNTNMLPANTILVDKTTYYAVQVGVNNCYSDPVAVTVTIVLDNAEFELIGLEYYPNPITSDFTIKSNDAIESITVFDNTGKRLLYKEYHQNIIKVDFSSFNSGQFMVRVQTSKGAQFIKVIKK